MPDMPIGRGSSQSVTTQSGGARQDPRSAGQAGRDMQAIGGGIISLSDQVRKVDDTWTKARVTNQYTTARNTRKAERNRILENASLEPDHENSQTYVDQLEDTYSTDVEIEDDNVKALYQSETELDKSDTLIKVREMFRNKMVNHTLAGIEVDGAEAEEAYISGTAEGRADAKKGRMERLKTWRETGFIDDKVYASEVEGMEDWEHSRALRMVGSNPKAVLEMVAKGEFDIKDPKQLLDITNTAKATIKRDAYLTELNTHETYTDNQAQLSTLIYGGADPETGEVSAIPLADKIELINKQNGLGLISDDFAIKARRYLTSAQKKTRVRSSFEFARVLRTVSSINARYEDKSDATPDVTYLKNIGLLQSTIMESDSPDADKNSFLNTIATRTAKGQADALLGIANQSPYAKADEFFGKELPLFRDQALMEYFLKHQEATEGGKKELTEAEDYKLQSGVLQQVAFKGKKSMLESIQFANERFPGALFVEPEQDPKTGRRYLRVGMDDGEGDIEIPLDEYGKVVRTKKGQ